MPTAITGNPRFSRMLKGNIEGRPDTGWKDTFRAHFRERPKAFGGVTEGYCAGCDILDEVTPPKSI